MITYDLLIILAKYSPGTRDKNALSFMGSVADHGMFVYLQLNKAELHIYVSVS